MLQLGEIQKSNSPWTNAVVLARKKGGELRFCIDFRKLNARMVPDGQTLPQIEEAIDRLSGQWFFTCLDMRMEFWHVEMDPKSRQYTAFTVGPLGFYECKCMPFGLTNAPATFQRMMESCLGYLHLNCCLIYLDDVVVYSKTEEEHLVSLRKVFERFRQKKLRLKPKKCHFFKTKVTYLGHEVSQMGIKPDQDSLEKVRSWPVPKEVTGMRRFLGFVNYFRKFIKNHVKLTNNLYKVIGGENTKVKSKEITLNEEQLATFEHLKQVVTEAPVLAFPDYNKPFKLVTDASGEGLGAILYQKQDDGHDHPIAFASRRVSESESRYHPWKMEFLVLKWAITERFHDYLYGAHSFHMQTDSSLLTYVLKERTKLDALGHRWVGALSNYNFSLISRAEITLLLMR